MTLASRPATGALRLAATFLVAEAAVAAAAEPEAATTVVCAALTPAPVPAAATAPTMVAAAPLTVFVPTHASGEVFDCASVADPLTDEAMVLRTIPLAVPAA